ncbi:hypothetical protein MSAN_01428900 [Mycena sanguinolenta]|uniref:Uncharacterized protein n=1 Tax=Mycena sanguinolenta TaxID=230812 RepID=A0A8H6Y8E5_9AGAR|nr:hypothetical protein MSAN_01428900 [Mycena sanguinolenta]
MFRQFTSTLLRSARPRPLYHARVSQRTLFGLGSKPAVGTPPLSEEELAKTTEWAQNLFKDKPDAVKAVIKVATVMEELGVQISAGQMPNPLQLLKLAKNPKFMEAYTEAQQEFKKAGIDMQSKELVEQMMKIINKRS